MRSPFIFALMSLLLSLAISSPALAQQPTNAPADSGRAPGAIQIRMADGSLVWYQPAADGSGVFVASDTSGAASGASTSTNSPWALVLFFFGLFGQAMFMGRFALQWIASERSGRSVVPLGFWWLSLAGATILLTYFALQREPIGVLGQVLGWPIYVRNIYMVLRDRRAGRIDPMDPAEHPVPDPNAEA